MKRLIIFFFICYSLYLYAYSAYFQNETTIYHRTSAYLMIKEGESLLKEGDLVVRLNRDPSSRFIKNFNRHDKSYSHSGIVLFENGYPYVFHIIDGEENPSGKLKMDSLKMFCNPIKNNSYGIYRYEMTQYEINNLKNIVHKLYAREVQFDNAFNLSTDDKMYCSEMISKVLKEATRKRISVEPTKLTTIDAGFFSAYTHLPFNYASHLSVISIDDLYTNPFCQLVKRYNFN
jgi:Permuted papain-like amidase enzyme, YaeF/YiiX, C92 family